MITAWRRLAAVVFVSLCVSRALDAQVGTTPPTLVRCASARAMSCFAVTLQRPVGSAAALKAVDTARSHWEGFAGTSRLIGPGLIRLGFDSTRKIRLLLAVDVSGSMKGEGIAFTRSALRSFLSALPSSGIEVALVPFESRAVVAGFAAVKFVLPTEAVAQLEKLPAPLSGNTALYSAIAEGLRVLDRPSAINGATVLVVLTDGVNDVGHARDDPGLLGGQSGRDQAQQLIVSSKHQIWLVGAGAGVDAVELKTLAGTRANATVVAMDPGALVALLAQIRMSLASQYTLVYGVPSGVATHLGRRPLRITIHGDSALLSRWRPPLLARAPFEGIADSTLLSSDLRVLVQDGTSTGSDRLILGGALLFVLLSAYAVLWRLARDAERGGVPVSATPSAKAVEKRAERKQSDATLRRDVVDAPPRTPFDITKDEAA